MEHTMQKITKADCMVVGSVLTRLKNSNNTQSNDARLKGSNNSLLQGSNNTRLKGPNNTRSRKVGKAKHSVIATGNKNTPTESQAHTEEKSNHVGFAVMKEKK